jgi:hypothetical protein
MYTLYHTICKSGVTDMGGNHVKLFEVMLDKCNEGTKSVYECMQQEGSLKVMIMERPSRKKLINQSK